MRDCLLAQVTTAFHTSYLAGRSRFWPTHFADAVDRRTRTQLAAQQRVTPEVLAVLREQNPHAPRAIESLARGNTAVVVTGQQVGLFLGPLYSLYKAATAITLAQKLSAQSGVACVPLFWLQTEDQDFAEIASAAFIGDGGKVQTVRVTDDPALTRASVAQRVLGPEIDEARQTLAASLGDRGAQVAELLARHYRPGISLARAFSGVLSEIFAEEQLLVCDPRDARLSACARKIWTGAISQDSALEALLAQRSAELQSAGFGEQIKLRAGSPLSFFHLGNSHGPRHRLQRDGESYRVLGAEGQLTRAELLGLVETDPLRFSTSAMLRPLLQDTLLPTAAYVGGAAELDYFAQLEPLFAAFDLTPPLLVHRARFRLWTAPASRAREALGLAENECAQSYEALAARCASTAGAELPGETWAKELLARVSHFSAGASSEQLERVANRTNLSITYAMSRLARAAERERAEKADSTQGRLRRLLAWMQPNGQPQERVLGFASFAARCSVAELRRAIFAALDPFSAELKDIHL